MSAPIGCLDVDEATHRDGIPLFDLRQQKREGEGLPVGAHIAEAGEPTRNEG